MNCAAFDIQCRVNEFFAQFWWLPYVGWGIGALILLFALSQIKNIAGWPGVFAVLTLGAYGAGYLKGRTDKGDSLSDIMDPKDSAPAPKKPAPRKQKTIVDIFKAKK